MGPVVSPRTYLFTWAALLGLTLATTLVGYLDLGEFSIIGAVLFAMAKGSLIVSFFMYAAYAHNAIRVILVGGSVWFTILFSITLGDYVTRGWLPFPGKQAGCYVTPERALNR
jgi:cytochrome c oxidase subunit 4